jgi:hypothetical protein
MGRLAANVFMSDIAESRTPGPGGAFHSVARDKGVFGA